MKTFTAVISRSIETYDLGEDYAPTNEFILRAEPSSDQVVWKIKELLIKLSKEKHNCWGVLLLDMICLKASNQDNWQEPIAHLLPVLKRMGKDKQVEHALEEFTAENIPKFKSIESFEWNRVGGMYWTPYYWWGYLKEYETLKKLSILKYQASESKEYQELVGKTKEEIVKNEDIDELNEMIRLGNYPKMLDPIIESLIGAQDGQLASEISLSGKRVCVTGKLSLKRKEIEQLLEAAGAIIASGVSNTTDILIAGEDAGSKLSKANELGIMVLTEEQAKKSIGLQ